MRFVMATFAYMLLLGAVPSQAQTIFTDGFESGNERAWTAAAGNRAIATGACHTGRFCGEQKMAAGRDQQMVLWERAFTHDGDTFYFSGWWRFPEGFTFDPGGQPWGYEHKLLIVNTANDVGRILLNLRGGGSRPEVAVHIERLEGLGQGVSKRSDVQLAPGGGWQHFELEVQRRSGTANRVRAWLNGELAVDETGRVCGTPCSPIVGVQVGAFSNQGTPRAQSFFLDDILVSGSSRGGAPEPEPEPTPTPTVDVEAALRALTRARAALNEAEQALR